MTLGIDFGTTQSRVAWVEGGEVRLIPDAQGNVFTPSVVAVGGRGDYLVGAPARAQALLNPERTLSHVKRELGLKEQVVLAGRHIPTVQLAAAIFSKLLDDARRTLGNDVGEAVVTVPAYFNDAQRKAVRESAIKGGWRVPRLVTEPTAAAMTLGEGEEALEKMVVFDLGGGTFDVSVLERTGGVFEVRAAGGHNHLGGADFDRLLQEEVASGFHMSHGVDLLTDPLAQQKLAEAVEGVKIRLSELESTRLHLPFISANASGPLHLDLELTRARFEELISRRLTECMHLTEKTLAEAGWMTHEVNRVMVVGGSGMIPAVRRALGSLFPKALLDAEAPLERVARGAAIQASILDGQIQGQVLVDVTPFSLGIEIDHGYFAPVIRKNTPIPVTEERLFTTLADNQKSVEVHVLQGESLQAADNFSLGRFVLGDIRMAPKGSPRIQVVFDLDVSGTLEVTARDLDTGKAQTVTLKQPSGGGGS